MQASHNRFEHSLGVAHLAYKFGSHLWNMQRGELDIERRDLELVSRLVESREGAGVLRRTTGGAVVLRQRTRCSC